MRNVLKATARPTGERLSRPPGVDKRKRCRAPRREMEKGVPTNYWLTKTPLPWRVRGAGGWLAILDNHSKIMYHIVMAAR